MTQPPIYTDQYGGLLCPMPDGRGSKCGQDMFWSWELEMPAALSDLSGEKLPVPGDAWSGAWKLRCLLGHTVLSPVDLTACEHGEGEDCPGHDEDSSEELRTVRLSDLVRLRQVLAALGPLVDLSGLPKMVAPPAAPPAPDMFFGYRPGQQELPNALQAKMARHLGSVLAAGDELGAWGLTDSMIPAMRAVIDEIDRRAPRFRGL